MDVIQEVGAYAGFAAVVGLAVLAALFFSQARDLRRLREWAGRAPERAAEQAAAQQAAAQVATPAPTGAVRPIPAAKPATAAPVQPAAKPAAAAAAQTGAKPATAAATAGQPAEAKPGEEADESKKPAEEKPGTEAPAPAAATAGKPAPATAAASPAAAKPTTAPGAKPGTAAPGTAGPKPATAAPGAKPVTTPPGPPAVGPPRPPAPVRPAGIPPRPAPVGRTPAAGATAQSTAVLPASARVRDSRRADAGRRLDARYIALIGAGVIVLGAGAVFGISQLGGDDDAPSTAERQARENEQPAGPLNRSLVTVSVLNGTTVPGLAAQIGDEIESKGFQRGNVANAIDQQRPASVVMFAEGAERPARVVARSLGITTVEPVDPDSQALAGNASVVVVVGMDQTQ